MIDFHAHILPGIDDGSSSVSESKKMLAFSAKQGVTELVATPHFYAMHQTLEEFIEKRRKAWELLSAELPENSPTVHLGAEVYYFSGISNMSEISELLIGESNTLLLEMPFKRWSSSMLDEISTLAAMPEIQVVLAHIDRYLEDEPYEIWESLKQYGVKFQMNASAVLQRNRRARRDAMMLISEKMIDVLGSDCHDMNKRKPNLPLAFSAIYKELGRSYKARLTRQSRELLYPEEEL